MENKTLQINSEYLDELIDYVGRSAVGKILKRFEIIQNKDILKVSTKELIYESFRSFRDLLIAHNKGLQIHQFQIKTQPREKNSTVK